MNNRIYKLMSTSITQTIGVNCYSYLKLVEANQRPTGVQLVNTERTNKHADPMDLVALAQTIQKADEMTKARVGSKLTVIADQIRYLQEQAKKHLEDAKRDNIIHHAACNLVKRPGTMYYMYERESGQKYMSILSPEEWGASCPHEFVGAYKLEYDLSWTPIEEVAEKSQEFALIDKILNAQNAIMDSSEFNLGLTKNSSTASVKDVTNESS
ncbi:Uncharacterized protein C1orf50,Uncharacterized protein C1orf50 homolog [Mytilus edulis]|uniref:Uncharacterized protein C1orf50,Uncharacterized protein C1orf50 homolog n=1 Tax=Mytilus edulis TaxID=6550 RepID=A0A8S3UDR2_MYTED|nr:Uncharacterized protein C1orf50,Uncharacterized protein C1orf50 homolog [Mytilus edulis]